MEHPSGSVRMHVSASTSGSNGIEMVDIDQGGQNPFLPTPSAPISPSQADAPEFTPLSVPQPYKVVAATAQNLPALSVWFLQPDGTSVCGLPLLGAHYDISLWSEAGMLKLFATFSNSSGQDIEAVVLVPLKEGRVTHALARVVTLQDGMLQGQASKMDVYESTVLPKEKLSELKQLSSTKSKGPAPVQQSMDQQVLHKQPKARKVKTSSIIELLAKHPMTGVTALPIAEVLAGQSVAVEIEVCIDSTFNPQTNKYELVVPTQYSSEQLGKPQQSLVPDGGIVGVGVGSLLAREDAQLTDQISSILSYSVHIHAPRFGNNRLQVGSGSHKLSSTLLHIPPGTIPPPAFDTYHVVIEGIKHEAIGDMTGQEKRFTPALTLEYELPKSDTIEVLALQEVDVPSWNFELNQPDPNPVEKGTFWIQVTPPSISSLSQDLGSVAPYEPAIEGLGLQYPPPPLVDRPRGSRFTPVIIARTLTFLLDVSGSMVGQPYMALAFSVTRALDGCTEKDRIQIILFDDELTIFSPEGSRPFNRDTKVDAIKFLRTFVPSVSAGTTAMTKAFEHVLNEVQRVATGSSGEYSSQAILYLVTDGSVDDEVTVARLVARKRAELLSSYPQYSPPRVLTLGLGPFVNSFFLQHLARSTGGGEAYFLGAHEMVASVMNTVMATQLELYGNASTKAKVNGVALKPGETLCASNQVQPASSQLQPNLIAAAGVKPVGEKVTSATCLRHVRVLIEMEDSFSGQALNRHSITDVVSTSTEINAPGFSPASPKNESALAYFRSDVSSAAAAASGKTVLQQHPLPSATPDLTFGQSLTIVGTYVADAGRRFPKSVLIKGDLPDGTPYQFRVPFQQDFTVSLPRICCDLLVDARAAQLIGMYGINPSPTVESQYLKEDLIRTSCRFQVETAFTTMVFSEVQEERDDHGPTKSKAHKERVAKGKAKIYEQQRQKQFQLYMQQQQQLQQQQQQGQFDPSYSLPSGSSSGGGVVGADVYIIPRPVYVVSPPRSGYAYTSPRKWGRGGRRYSTYYDDDYYYGGGGDAFWDWYIVSSFFNGGGVQAIAWLGGNMVEGGFWAVSTLGHGLGSIASSIANISSAWSFDGVLSFLKSDLGCCSLCCQCQHGGMEFVKFLTSSCWAQCGNICEISKEIGGCCDCCLHFCKEGGGAMIHCCGSILSEIDWSCICNCCGAVIGALLSCDF